MIDHQHKENQNEVISRAPFGEKHQGKIALTPPAIATPRRVNQLDIGSKLDRRVGHHFKNVCAQRDHQQNGDGPKSFIGIHFYRKDLIGVRIVQNGRFSQKTTHSFPDRRRKRLVCLILGIHHEIPPENLLILKSLFHRRNES